MLLLTSHRILLHQLHQLHQHPEPQREQRPAQWAALCQHHLGSEGRRHGKMLPHRKSCTRKGLGTCKASTLKLEGHDGEASHPAVRTALLRRISTALLSNSCHSNINRAVLPSDSRAGHLQSRYKVEQSFIWNEGWPTCGAMHRTTVAVMKAHCPILSPVVRLFPADQRACTWEYQTAARTERAQKYLLFWLPR